MYKIYIDSSKRYEKSITLLDKSGNTIEVVSGDIDIVPSIKSLLQRHEINKSEVLFEANLGPGESFMGLKIGSVISNVLNWAIHNKPIIELPIPDYGREPNISQRKELK